MSSSINAATFFVARSGTTVFVRATGLANMKNAPTLHGFLENEQTQGMRFVCLDLAGCMGMDSTFMGLMVDFAKRLEESQGRLVIVNPGDKNRNLLAMLGVDEIVHVVDECPAPAADFAHLESEANLSTKERMQLIRTAHEQLVRLSDANQQKFSTFLTALNADMKKLNP